MNLLKLARRGSTAALGLCAAAALAGCTTAASTPSSDASSAVSGARSRYPEPIDLAKARARCLEQSGWAVTVRDDATITADLEPGTESDYRQDDANCLKSLGIDPDAPPTQAQLRRAYEVSVKGAACLRDGGWSISNAPTFDTFVDKYESDPWYPWAEVSDEDFAEATKLCPTPEPTY